MRWLRSPSAIKVHIVFLAAIGLLTFALFNGDQGPANDYPVALAWCCIAYPAVLALVWVKWRAERGSEW